MHMPCTCHAHAHARIMHMPCMGQAGILGMANTGPHSAHSQFYVTLRALPSFDCKTVAFGRLIDGSRVLEFIGALDTKMDRPLGKVTVCSCGKLAAVELGDYDKQAAVVRLRGKG